MAYECEEEIIDPSCDECGDEIEAGRLRSAAFLNATAYAAVKEDPENPTIWATQKANGNIKIVPNVRGSYDGGTPVEVTGYGDTLTQVIGYDCTATFSDPSYKSNYDFYNSISGRKSQYFAFRTETQTHLTEVKVSISVKNTVDEDINSNVAWTTEVKWRQKNIVKPFDTPEDIFICGAAEEPVE